MYIFSVPYNKEREQARRGARGVCACLCAYAARPPSGKATGAAIDRPRPGVGRTHSRTFSDAPRSLSRGENDEAVAVAQGAETVENLDDIEGCAGFVHQPDGIGSVANLGDNLPDAVRVLFVREPCSAQYTIR